MKKSQLDNNINYSEYLMESLSRSIIYSEYIAEQIDKSMNYAQYLGISSKSDKRKKAIKIILNES